MSTTNKIEEKREGWNPVEYDIGGKSVLDIDSDNRYFSSEPTNSVMITSEDAEKSITGAMKGVTQYLSDHKYDSGEISTSVRELSSGKEVEEYTIRVPVAVTDAEEWVNIESDLQSIALDSETGNTNLYLVVDRFGS